MQRSGREDLNRRMLRARDEMDHCYAEPLDVPRLAAVAHLSTSQFGRAFKAAYGETPHRYLQRRRVERAMTLLRQTDRPVTNVAWDVGFASLGTFSSTFRSIVGCSPSSFRARHDPVAVPSCFIAAWTRPRQPVVATRPHHQPHHQSAHSFGPGAGPGRGARLLHHPPRVRGA